jgi:hypothetical protein
MTNRKGIMVAHVMESEGPSLDFVLLLDPAGKSQIVSLTVPKLSLQQKAHIRMLCERRLQSFVQKRGIGIWDYRLLDEEPIPDSLQIMAASFNRSRLCWNFLCAPYSANIGRLKIIAHHRDRLG